MSELSEKFLEASRRGNFLKTALESTYGEINDTVIETLVNLHNTGTIDLIEQFKALFNNQDSALDFFSTRHLLERALPLLNSPVHHVMECVAHLAKEAGQDMAANTIFTSFTDFCVADPLRPEQALRLIKESPNQWMDFILPVIVAGTRIDMESYFMEAICLTSHEDIEVRKRSIYAIGGIQYPKQSELPKQALDCLEHIISQESDDHVLANTVKSICNICMSEESFIDRGRNMLDTALSKGGDYTVHAAAQLFGIDFNKLPETLLDVIMRYLQKLNPKNKGTLNMIDHGVIQLFKRIDPTKGIEFLESLLLAHAQDLSIKFLNSFVHEMHRSDKKLLNKMLTRWFLKGERVLCDGIRIIADAAHGQELLLEVDIEELLISDPLHLIFLAHKAIGYLFLKPITAANVIISLMRQAGEANTIHQLSSLLFDPLLLNYSGTLRNFLIGQVTCEVGQTKNGIQSALDMFDAYLEDLKSVGEIPEMYPSQDQREALARHMHEMMSKAYEEAMKGSILNFICTKSVILYGRKSINYIQIPGGQYQRMEIPMSSHGAEVEIPRQEHFDPLGLQYMLRMFKAERLKTK